MKKTHTKSVIKTVALSLALVILASTLLLLPTEAANTSAMGALIDSFQSNDSTFTLTTGSRLFVVTDTEPTGTLLTTVQLAQKQFAAAGFPSEDTMEIVWGDDSMALAGDILLVLDTSSALVDDGYKLNVTTTAVVTAKNTRGLLYGLNMLLKHFRNGGENAIKGFTARDEPDTKERTLHLDCARKYYTKEWICNMIREISWMGFNAIELHFSEDGGFRMDFWDPAYFTSPTGNDFSWVCGNEPQWWYYDQPAGVDNELYLRTTEIIDILNVAKEYQIDVIPSFDTPGHVDYLTYKYYTTYKTNPSIATFQYDGTTYTLDNAIHYLPNAAKDDAGFNSNFKVLDLADEKVKKFIFAMYTDIAAFFKQYAGSTNFNIGADEIGFVSGSSVGYPQFYQYTNELYSVLHDMGYKVRMYNDFVDNTKYDLPSTGLNSNIEIVYWTSPSGNSNGIGLNSTIQNVAYHLNNGRKVYSGHGLWTYYALRVFNTPGYEENADFGKDARNPTVRWWTMFKNGEEDSYDGWNPTRMPSYFNTSTNVYTDYTYSGDQLAGGYFMIWCDYSGLNTEQEIWNGVEDRTGKGDYFYDLRARMWSNIIKQWNWDINNTVSFSSFEELRDSMGDFPGLASGTNGCSTKANLPTATDPIRLISQADLLKKIDAKVAQGIYTDESYNAYSAAYDKAYAIATAATLDAEDQYKIPGLIDKVTTTKAALTIKTFTITINHHLKGTTTPVKDTEIHSTTTKTNHYSITVPSLNRHRITSIEGTTGYTQDATGVTFTGDATSNLEITIYYLDVSALEDLIATGDSLNAAYYTADTWTAYSTALTSAKAVIADPDATQEQVNAAAATLKAAQEALESRNDSKDTPLTVEVLNDTVPKGKQVGFRITSEANVKTLTITCNGITQTPIFCSSEVQVLKDGDIVTMWLVFLKADTAGSFTYTINDTVSVDVTVVEPASN